MYVYIKTLGVLLVSCLTLLISGANTTIEVTFLLIKLNWSLFVQRN